MSSSIKSESLSKGFGFIHGNKNDNNRSNQGYDNEVINVDEVFLSKYTI